jgi:nitroreductase
MDVKDAIRERRSVRRYKDKSIERILSSGIPNYAVDLAIKE